MTARDFRHVSFNHRVGKNSSGGLFYSQTGRQEVNV